MRMPGYRPCWAWSVPGPPIGSNVNAFLPLNVCSGVGVCEHARGLSKRYRCIFDLDVLCVPCLIL